MSPQVHYTSRQVARIATLTARQLQWWDENGVLSPKQERHRRLYTAEETFTALLFRELRARGFSLEYVRLIQRQIQKQAVSLPDPARPYLLTNGERVVLLEHPDVVLAFLAQRRSPVYQLISLEALAQKMRVESGKLAMRRGPVAALLRDAAATLEPFVRVWNGRPAFDATKPFRVDCEVGEYGSWADAAAVYVKLSVRLRGPEEAIKSTKESANG